MSQALPDRISLAQLPTPLERLDRLSAAWGGPTIWVKRDDLTGFGLSGNKARKLEFHFAAARAAGCDTVITCGAAQSNHSRTTALTAARLGFGAVLYLRTPDGLPPDTITGNLLLDRLAGAEIRFITPEQYQQRDRIMADAAAELGGSGRRPWVIPEGASDVLGMWGFVVAMRELADQLVHLGGATAGIWHAASSGATTAGLGWAADRLGLDIPIMASSVGDTAPDLAARVDRIWEEAAAAHDVPLPQVDIDYIDRHVGRGYGLTTPEELSIQAEASALTGLIFDPTYTGKALVGLRREIDSGRFTSDDQVVFWHTGGGFAVFSHDFGDIQP